MEFGARYRADAEVRERIARGDSSDLAVEVPEGVEVRVVQQTSDTYYYYFPLPQAPTGGLSVEALESISGGTGFTNTGRAAGLNAAQLFTAFDQTFGIASVGPGRSSP